MYYKRYDDFSAELKPINLQEITPALVVLLFGILLSVAIMLMEQLHFKFKNRHRTNNGIIMHKKVNLKLQQKIIRNKTLYA